MRDLCKPCHHCVSEDTVYKEVVVIGNGPSGIITSFMLSGRVPYLKKIPSDLPLDEMLLARLREVPEGQSLYDVSLEQLAEGLEGRSRNPVPLLMDNLLNPCADIGLQEEPLVEWRYDVDKQIEHVVLGKGPPGGAWHGFAPSVLTLSPSGWLALPPHSSLPGRTREQRAPAAALADYYRQYVRAQGLQRFFRSGVVVTGVTLQPGTGPPCRTAGCPLAARWCVTGYDTVTRRVFRYACSRVVLASGASDRPGALPCGVAARAQLDLSRLDVALAAAAAHPADDSFSCEQLSLDSRSRASGQRIKWDRNGIAILGAIENTSESSAPVLVVGSGLSAADAVTAARRAGRRTAHVYRPRATALAALSPQLYPDYCEVQKMMQDGISGNHENYIPLPDHAVVEVQPIQNGLRSELHDMVAPKRVKLVDLVTNEVKEMTVTVIFVLIGSKPDLHFLPGNFDLSYINVGEESIAKRREICAKCNNQHATKRKMEENVRQCFLKNHWYYIKSMVGQGIQSCKSKYWDYITDVEINGNTDTNICISNGCKRRGIDNNEKQVATHKDDAVIGNKDEQCKCHLSNPHSSGLGFGIDPKKPVDSRSNPIHIDQSTHEVINAPQGMYAVGPLTSDNFVRFICGGALAAVAHIRREIKLEMTD